MHSLTEPISLSEPSLWADSSRCDQVFARLRREQPVSWQSEPTTIWSGGGRGYWAVTRHADVVEASKKTEIFASGLGTELIDLPLDVARAFSGMINMDAPEHAQMRTIVNAAFTPRQISTLSELVRRRTKEIVNIVCELGKCDFAIEVADALPTTIICDLLAVPNSDRDWVARTSRATHPLGDPEFGNFDAAYGAAGELIGYGRELLKARSHAPADDITSVLAKAMSDGRLGESDAGTYFMLLITAGIETTGAAIAHGLIALTNEPRARDEWRRDYEVIAPTAVDEILRWATPVVHFRRTAIEDTELGGTRIAAGDKVVLFYNSANRDETVFAEPDALDLRRRPNPHVTFGAGGPHFCLGAHLARFEMIALYRELFVRLPDITVVGSPTMMLSMFFNGIKSLPCAFTPGPRQLD
jgi:methyl-branched lipid omega-hydroxylase